MSCRPRRSNAEAHMKEALMVKNGKVNGVKEQDISNGERSSRVGSSSANSDIICFICGVQNANWAIYSKSRDGPFFPFLDFHTAPPGTRAIDHTTGKVDCCTVCFSFLTQQWHAFEASDTPIIKRLYWLKRPGSDTDCEKKLSDQDETNGKDDACVGSSHSCTEKGAHSELEQIAEEQPADRSVKKSLCSSSRKELSSTSSVKLEASECPQRECDSPNNSLAGGRKSALETCYICSRRKPKEFMRSVHTRPQLKTETPFYPCLARHSPAATAKKMDYLGKVLVCEACQKFLFRQWQVFQRNATPLGERQYQLRSDPTLPREQQSSLSTMVCFICGVTQPATSGRFLYSRKHTPGEAFYPFLDHLKPPQGAMPLTQQGLTRACSGCRKSLHRQWKQFEALKVTEEEREYRIRNDRVITSLPTTTSDQNMSPANIFKISCYTCGESCQKCDLKLIYSKANVSFHKEKMYFPFIVSLEPPLGCKLLDDSGRTLVCKKCFRYLQEKWEEFDSIGIPHSQRNYKFDTSNMPLDKQEICFLCGIAVKLSIVQKLYLYPHGGTGVTDGGPFFPFLATKEPAHNAQPPDSEGTVSACEICHNNLLMQWQQYEKSDIPEESNRWQRKYYTSRVRCYVCGMMVLRSTVAIVNIKHVSLPENHKPPTVAVMVNNGREIVICESCPISAKTECEFRPDELKGFKSVSGWTDNECGQELEDKCTSSDKGRLLQTSDRDPVIVVNSSDSEDDSNGHVTSKRAHSGVSQGKANVSLMHYTVSSSPVVQPSLHTRDSPGPPSPNSTMQSNARSQASFAAALRKLAKQAVPLAGPNSPVTSASGSQSPNPHPMGKPSGASPSMNSPMLTPTPPLARQDSVSVAGLRDRPDRQLSPGYTRICTPPKHSASSVDTDLEHRSQSTGEGVLESSRELHTPHSVESENHSPKVPGHQVMPGVYSCGTRGTLQEGPMLSEHFPAEHPPPHVPHYLHAMKPEPFFVPRSGAMAGPPTLIASGREGPEPHIVPAFYPSHFPPHINMMDPIELANAETWRQQRAVEHLRQQHERHTHLWPDDVPHSHPGELPRHIHPVGAEHFRPRESLQTRTEDTRDHLLSGNNEHFRQQSESSRTRIEELRDREARKQEKDSQDLRPSSVERSTESKDKENDSAGDERRSSPGHGHRAGLDQMPVIQRVYYYNDNKPSCPVHGHGVPPTSIEEQPRSHSSGPVTIEPGHGPKPDGPEDPRVYGTKAEHPDGLGRLYGRIPDHTEEIGRMFGSKPEGPEEFSRLYGHKPEDHGHLFFHRHPDAQLLQPYLIHHPARERPFPGLPMDEQHAEVMRENHRQELMLQQRVMFDPKDHFKLQEAGWHRWQHHLRQQKEERHQEMTTYQHQHQHQHLLQQQEMEKRDMALKDPRLFQDLDRAKHSHPDGLREHRAAHPVGFHSNQYSFPDVFPIYPERLVSNSSGSNRNIAESDWRKHGKAVFLNGDCQSQGRHSFSREDVRGSHLDEAVKRIKVEKPDEDAVVQPPPRVQHDPAKLRFLEGLGLVTVDRKKELSRGEPSLKRKFEGELVSSEMNGPAELSQGKDSEETSEETVSDADSAATSTDNDFNSEAFYEKMEFMSKLGLVPPQRRQEMEKSFEIRRSERKMRKSRGRPKKRTRKEVDKESENSPPILDIEKLSGPITRNRQQLIAEQEQLLGLAHSQLEDKKADRFKEQPIQMQAENQDRRSSPFVVEYKETNYPQTDNERHLDPNRRPPRLTLKSLTNMEDPFTNSSASNFRPPYLRHTGLLSISKDHPGNSVLALPPNPSELKAPPIRPEPVRTGAMPFGEVGTREYLSGRSGLVTHPHPPPCPQGFELAGVSTSESGRSYDHSSSMVLLKESRQNPARQEERPGAKLLRWPGVEAVMQAYYIHAAENEVERGVLNEDSEALRSHNNNLNEQAQQLSMRMTNLVQTKRQLLENKRSLRAELDKLHFFVQSFQR